ATTAAIVPMAETRERMPAWGATGRAGIALAVATTGAVGIAMAAGRMMEGAAAEAGLSSARRSRRLMGWCGTTGLLPCAVSGFVGPRSAADSTGSVTAVLLQKARGCSRLPARALDVEFSRNGNGRFPADPS